MPQRFPSHRPIAENRFAALMQYDGEFRREEATSTVGSNAKH